MVASATRAPGRPQYERMHQGDVARIVNNIATRALADGETDPAIDRFMADIESQFQPDIVHVHHTQFLSSTMKFAAPTVVTLHDQWAWCAAGGLGLRNRSFVCEGPEPIVCADCHASWRPAPSTTARLLTRGAGLLSPLVEPDRLHRLYKRIPASLRPSPLRGSPTVESPRAAAHRNEQVLGWYRCTDARIAPSAHLAALATEHGLGPVEVIRHGVDDSWLEPSPEPSPERSPGAPFVHIGTIAHHKGTDRVVSAHRALTSSFVPDLKLHGPVLDPEAACGHPVGRVLNPNEVRAVLRSARALVLGARWPENAPLIILEARAAGCPVIAPDIGGIPELIEDGVDGILWNPDDDSALTRAMETLLDEPTMRPNPPPNFEAKVDQIESVYRRIITSKA
jgi:glycosyltransferase involved in cell wall biosynthesis